MEEWVELETRDIAMPDGSMQPVEMNKLCWQDYDFMVECDPEFTHEELVGYGIEESGLQKVGFQEAFRGIIMLLGNQYRQS